MNFLNKSVINRVLFSTLISIFVGMSILAYMASSKTYDALNEADEKSIQNELTLILGTIKTFNSVAKSSADQLGGTFSGIIGSNVVVDPSRTVKVGEFDTPLLTANGEVINLNFEKVDRFLALTKGSVATVFVKQGNDFIRISTSLKKEDGSRAIGTKLDVAHPGYKKVLNGEEYVGKAKLFGKDYMTKYIPIKHNGTVIGILFIGFDITAELEKLMKNIESIKIGKTGYYYIVDSKEGDTQGTFLYHPTLKGKNNLETKDVNGFEFVKEMIAKKNGMITYEWENKTKFSAFQEFDEWHWLIVGGTYVDEIEEKGNDIRNLILLISIILLALVSVVIYGLLKKALSPLNAIQTGLLSFFRFLNRESTKAELIDLKSEDEFGQMAKVINENITSIEKGLVADANAVANAVQVANRVKAGHLNEQINVVPNNPQLAELRSVLNEMLTGLNGNVEKVLSVLKVYANNDFNPRADKASLQGEVASLIDGVNNLGNEISTMLGASLRNGMELQGDAGSLKQAVEALSTASNEQAASLEETAAAMEEMTSNVQQNAQKANDMASMAAQTDASAKEGAELAHRTATAMTEIQEATNSINSAVAIIENIAFQTNILSLNAAVEAATAGEAGKGFAVVAQEVRNLANRSADAAKEIKALAEQAASKSSEGMSIATELTRGFEVIAGKIEQTTMLVQDVSNASREQMQGISQINTAVTQLDQMTQENAKIAAEADNIANSTIDKAQAMVTDASSKNFVGKSDIQASGMHHNTARPAHKPAARSAHKAAPAAKPATFVPTAKSEDDIWESF
jgi:methyl-accepting chemotaxis protein-2 (aspartate sensor receptor)